MSLYCMESLGNFYREEENKVMDNEYKFYDSVLVEYIPFIEEGKKLVANESHTKYFNSLGELYSISKSKPSKDRSEAEEAADSLMFFISNGLITVEKDGTFSISCDKLQEVFLHYEEMKQNKKGEVLVKGSRK